MLDQLFYAGRWLELVNQRPLDRTYWDYYKLKKTVVEKRSLRRDDYACEWALQGSKLFLLSIKYTPSNLDITQLVTNSPSPIFAEWFSDDLDAEEDFDNPTPNHSRSATVFRFKAGMLTSVRHYKR